MATQRIPASVWRARIVQLRASGLSLEAYAEQSSYPVDRLRYWSQRLDREERQARLIPVRVESSARPSSQAAIEVCGPSGWLVRLGADVNPSWLAALLAGLR